MKVKYTNDKVGDKLTNQAGSTTWKIVSQRFSAPTGYDDGETKIRLLMLRPSKRSNGGDWELSDTMLEYYRKKKILKRIK